MSEKNNLKIVAECHVSFGLCYFFFINSEVFSGWLIIVVSTVGMAMIWEH